jgi:hypothetical protein
MAIDISIKGLKDKVAAAGGLQRTNRFLVTIDNAKFRQEMGSSDATNQYMAETVLFPDIALTTQADGLAGPGLGRTSPRGLSYTDGLMITFPIFGNLKFLDTMNKWIKSFYAIRTGGYALSGQAWITDFYDNSVLGSNIIVDLLDLNGAAQGSYVFTEVFPVELAPMQLSTMSNNEYLKLTVRFAFRNYTFTKSNA